MLEAPPCRAIHIIGGHSRQFFVSRTLPGSGEERRLALVPEAPGIDMAEARQGKAAPE